MDITSLLSPNTVQEFGQTWNRQSCVFQGRADRFAELAFDHAELKIALQDGQLTVKAQYVDPDAGHTELTIEPSRIDEYFAQGMTICVQNIDKVLPRLRQQSAILRRSMHFPGTVNFSCYWSPQSGGFDLHCDDHPVFILQIKGMKKWYYCATSAVERVFGSVVYSAKRLRDLRAIGLEIRDPDRLESVTLTPGDMLYLPAGTWHKTCAMSGESLGLTLRCFEGSAFDLVQNMLDKHMTMNRWHEMLPLIAPSGTDRLSIPPDLEALFAARLGELKDFVAGLTIVDLAQIWAGRFVHPGIGRAQPAAVAADDQLLVSKNAVVLRSDDRRNIGTYWVHNGLAECKLSLSDPAWFENVMRAGSFTASQRCCHWGSGGLSWETARSWLEELVDVGLVYASSEGA